MEEREIAKRILRRISPIVSAEHDKFGGWLAAGSGAGLALLIGHSEQMLKSIASLNFFLGAIFILISLLVYARQRWIGSQVIASVAAMEATEEVLNERKPEQIDVHVLLEEMASRSLWPFDKAMRKAANGNTEHETHITHLAQRQTRSVAIQVFFTVSAVIALLLGIRI